MQVPVIERVIGIQVFNRIDRWVSGRFDRNLLAIQVKNERRVESVVAPN